MAVAACCRDLEGQAIEIVEQQARGELIGLGLDALVVELVTTRGRMPQHGVAELVGEAAARL